MRWGIVLGVATAALVAGSVLAWTSIRQDREFQRLIAAGDAALVQEQTFTAIEAFSGALALKPDSMLAYLKRGDTYRRRGELAAALRDLRAASALEPTAPRPVELLGDVNAGMGRYERAIDDYRRFISLDDRSPRVLYKLAHTYYRNAQVSKAVGPLHEALAMDGRLGEAHYLLGLCLRETGHPQDAVTSLRRALELEPGMTVAREELVGLYDALRRDRESIEQLEALATLEPGRPERLVRVGLAYARQGRTDAAIATLSRAAERYPDDSAVLHGVRARVARERRCAPRSCRHHEGTPGAGSCGVAPCGKQRDACAIRTRAVSVRQHRRRGARAGAGDLREFPSSRSRIDIFRKPPRRRAIKPCRRTRACFTRRSRNRSNSWRLPRLRTAEARRRGGDYSHLELNGDRLSPHLRASAVREGG